MIVLGLDSAGQGCGVCVWSDGTIVSEVYEPMTRGQDSRLIPMVTEALSKAKITFREINRIAVTRGPGSFTGLRIGLAAAQGFGLAHNIPVLGFDRFDLYAHNINNSNLPPSSGLLIVLASQRQELYCRFDPSPEQKGTPALMTPEEIGNLIQQRPNLIAAGDARPDNVPNWQASSALEATICATLAATTNPADPRFAPTPLYLRRPDITLSATALTLESLGATAQPTLQEQAQTLAALHAESFGPSAWNALQFEQSLALPTTSGKLIRQNGVPAGFILLQLAKPDAEILTFCVRPDLREHGLGARLMAESVHEAEAKGCETLFLEVASDNAAACKLYERNGFRLMGQRKGYYERGSSRADALTYQKPLKPA